MRKISLLGTEFLVALLVVLGGALFLYLGVAYYTRENMGNVGSFMSGVFGSAVALAGAIVAIALAKHALYLQLEQQSRENVQSHFEMLNVISENLEEAMQPIVDVMAGMQSVYSASGMADHLIIQFIENHLPSRQFADLPIIAAKPSAAMQRDIDEIRQRATGRMQEAFADMALKCRTSPAIKNPVSAFLLSRIGGGKFQFGSHQVPLSETQLWATLFQATADRLAQINGWDNAEFLQHVVAARTLTYNYMVDKDGYPFDDLSLRALLLIDKLCTGDDRLTGTILGFYDNLPGGKEITDAVKRLMPTSLELSAGLAEVLGSFDVRASLDSSLIQAITAYRRHQPRMQEI